MGCHRHMYRRTEPLTVELALYGEVFSSERPFPLAALHKIVYLDLPVGLRGLCLQALVRSTAQLTRL